jgi:hypothetical protein
MEQPEPTLADVIHAMMPLAAAATRGMTRCGVDRRGVRTALSAADATCPDCRGQAGAA